MLPPVATAQSGIKKPWLQETSSSPELWGCKGTCFQETGAQYLMDSKNSKQKPLSYSGLQSYILHTLLSTFAQKDMVFLPN